MSLTSMQILVSSSCLFVTSGPVRAVHFCSLVLFLTCPTWFDLFNRACVASSTLLLIENPFFIEFAFAANEIDRRQKPCTRCQSSQNPKQSLLLHKLDWKYKCLRKLVNLCIYAYTKCWYIYDRRYTAYV